VPDTVPVADSHPTGDPGEPVVSASRARRGRRPPMEERIAAERGVDPRRHDWVVAAEVSVDTKTAKHADLRQSLRALRGCGSAPWRCAAASAAGRWRWATPPARRSRTNPT
jgi:hypothetical protein